MTYQDSSVPILRDPHTPIEVASSWANLPEGERKRRAYFAIDSRDIPELKSLFTAFILMKSQSKLDTSPHTIDSYLRAVDRLARYTQKMGVALHQMNEDLVDQMILWLQDDGLKPASINLRLAGCAQFYRALEWCRCSIVNPFLTARLRDPVPAHSKAVPYSDNDLRRLLDSASPREVVLILLGCDCGFRISDMVALVWDDVDLEGRALTITGKGRKRDSIFMTPRTTQALWDWLQVTPSQGPNVIPIGRRGIQAAIKSLCNRAGVKHRGAHALRHSAGTRLYRQEKDLKVVQRHLRHSNIQTTARYAHLADSDYKKAIDNLA